MSFIAPKHKIYCECQQEHCPHCNDLVDVNIEFLLKNHTSVFKVKNKNMKLSRALKEKKRLAAEIAHIKNQMGSKNSYIENTTVANKFPMNELYTNLQKKVQELVNLKIVINEANKEIQSSIYLLGEYKAMISFFNGLNVTEGPKDNYRNDNVIEYIAQFDEIKKNELSKEYQDKADRLQDQIDTYNFTTEIAWGEEINKNSQEK